MMVGCRAASRCLLLSVFIGGCGSSPRALGMVVDAAPSEPAPDLVRADALPSDAVPFETGTHVSSCGNGQLDPGEACDDGNIDDRDGCDQFCRLECPLSESSCRPTDTSPTAVCGDGLRAAGEACDDGNVVSGDGCTADCRIVEPGWTCSAPGRRCFPACGDRVVTPPETCDDGNLASGDGCSSTCVTEKPCVGDAGATVSCAATCGNGQLDGAEECDDGPNNADVAGACSTACHLLYCGDGVVTPPETCDLGRDVAPTNYSVVPGQGCSSDCRLAHYCGDGIVDTGFGEQCDLGSANGQPMSLGGTTCVICESACLLAVDC